EGVAITFDDGFENLAGVGWPLLRERGFPATVFVATDWAGRRNDWDAGDARIPSLPLVGWDVLRELADEGLAVGSHSCAHVRLTPLDDARLADELALSREAIQREIGAAPRAFAYPYGDHDERVARAVRAAGYACAVTTELRALDGREGARFALPRLDGWYLAKPGVMEAWGSAAFRGYVLFRHAARRIRRSLAGPGFGS
ncbi:MAG TPA: polysaccharide deacetylase family protein, partial [Longimicrobiales bacterium]|nr:polysaccharide deacetylase family protein [Longimicrobiales bacterium]